ncbi:hypothetical protein GCM10009682_40520 [Luedemannella flava]|uniref:Uncharacterized protein n=1 Tax=Luedemannella flava TaxID=349316 RepID=A0ABN2M989_9ACTN
MAAGRPFARFPLVARPRPVCMPLADRVADLTARASAATATGDLASAASVYNLAALIASDCDLPDLARQWCHDHTSAYLRATNRGAQVGRYALEPMVNLARLHIRAGRSDSGYQLLEGLFTAITNGDDVRVEGFTVPADLIAGDEERRTVREWLWTILLSDGTRALASAGRWAQAHRQLRAYGGIGKRMLDGRQVAVIAHATAGDLETARRLVDTTDHDEQPWLNAVTACLAVLCNPEPFADQVDTMTTQYQQLALSPELAVFGTRLGLAVIEAAGGPTHPAAQAATTRLVDHAMAVRDGYAARDVLKHPGITALLQWRQQVALCAVVRASALDGKDMPPRLRLEIEGALTAARAVIRSVSTA